MLWPKKISYKEFDNEKKFLRLENSPPPHNFSNGPSLNPLSLNNDQYQFFPDNTQHCQEIRLWELKKWSPHRKCFDILSKSLNSLRKCEGISLENLYVDIKA